MSSPTRRRQYLKSSSFQMALLFTVLCGATVLVLGYFIYFFSRGHYVYGTEKIIDTEIYHISRLQKNEDIVNALSRPDRVFLLRDAQEKKIEGYWESVPKIDFLLIEGILVFSHEEKRYAAKIHTYPDGRSVLVGIDITHIERTFRTMVWVGSISIGFIILVILVSYLISYFVVNRTNNIALIARNIIDTGDLSRRLPIDNQWDDLSYLSDTLNSFLGRIEELMAGVRQVTDNIAHDLRTPLTRLKNDLESLKAGNHDISYDDLIQEADHLLKSFSALLRISRIESGKLRGAFQNIKLDDLVRDAVELYEPLAEEKAIRIIHDIKPVTFSCDPDLMFQAIANLIDNAIKFSPEHNNIVITLKQEKDKKILSFQDYGQGVAEEEQKNIFKRFFRADQSRHTSGTGLGLSLVKAVIDLHKGLIEVANTHPGFCVTIIFKDETV